MSLSKLGEYLDKFDLRPGDEIQDHESRTQLRELLRRTRESKPSFDEHQLFTLNDDPLHNSETLQLKEDFRLHFRNISRIMDCVGCDKCRLWGKVQVTGIGTALKLLFAFEASNATYVQRDIVNFSTQVTLRRNELVSLTIRLTGCQKVYVTPPTATNLDSRSRDIPPDLSSNTKVRGWDRIY